MVAGEARSPCDSGDSAGRSILRRSWFSVWGVDVDEGCVIGPGFGDYPNILLLADCAPLDGLGSHPQRRWTGEVMGAFPLHRALPLAECVQGQGVGVLFLGVRGWRVWLALS